jgi:hypothetical protein
LHVVLVSRDTMFDKPTPKRLSHFKFLYRILCIFGLHPLPHRCLTNTFLITFLVLLAIGGLSGTFYWVQRYLSEPTLVHFAMAVNWGTLTLCNLIARLGFFFFVKSNVIPELLRHANQLDRKWRVHFIQWSRLYAFLGFVLFLCHVINPILIFNFLVNSRVQQYGQTWGIIFSVLTLVGTFLGYGPGFLMVAASAFVCHILVRLLKSYLYKIHHITDSLRHDYRTTEPEPLNIQGEKETSEDKEYDPSNEFLHQYHQIQKHLHEVTRFFEFFLVPLLFQWSIELIADIITLIDNYSLLSWSSTFGIAYEIVFLTFAALPIAIVTHYFRKISPQLHLAYGELLSLQSPSERHSALTRQIEQTLNFMSKNAHSEGIELIGIIISPSLFFALFV